MTRTVCGKEDSHDTGLPAPETRLALFDEREPSFLNIFGALQYVAGELFQPHALFERYVPGAERKLLGRLDRERRIGR